MLYVYTIKQKQLKTNDMKTVTFNCPVYGWKEGDKLEISKETKKSVVTYDEEGKKRLFNKCLFKEYE